MRVYKLTLSAFLLKSSCAATSPGLVMEARALVTMGAIAIGNKEIRLSGNKPTGMEGGREGGRGGREGGREGGEGGCITEHNIRAQCVRFGTQTFSTLAQFV